MTKSNYDDSDRLDSIKSDAVRYLWAGYFVFVLLSSLIGDTTILIASIKYRAIKLHKVIVVIIQHIAVCDLLISITDVFVKLVSVITGDWVFGDLLCHLSIYTRYYFNPVSIFLIVTMTTSKSLILVYPLRSGAVTRTRAHCVCAASWTVASLVPLAGFIVDDDHDAAYFTYKGYQCAFDFSDSKIFDQLKPVIVVLIAFIPTVVIICTTLIILMVIGSQPEGRFRELRNRNRQGAFTTVLTAIIYCCSFLPTGLHSLPNRKFIENASFYRVASSLLALNTISNFYIYSLTVPSFREFIIAKLERVYRLLTGTTETAHRGLLRCCLDLVVRLVRVLKSFHIFIELS